MEIVLRAAAIFFFLWIITRVVGRTTLGELSTFELVLYVTVGDLVQQAVTQQDYSVTGGILAVTTFGLLTVLLSWIQWRFPRTRPLIRGVPVVVLRDGRLLEDVARQQRITEDDVTGAARQQGIRSLADVELAVLEPDGKISFFTRSEKDGESGAPPGAEVG